MCLNKCFECKDQHVGTGIAKLYKHYSASRYQQIGIRGNACNFACARSSADMWFTVVCVYVVVVENLVLEKSSSR